MKGGQVAKDPKPSLTEIASALAMTTLDDGTLCPPFEVNNQLTAIETVPVESKIGLNTMPYDIMTLIFDELSLCSKTCLGVTCKMFYQILKKQHPRPISSCDEFGEDEVIYPYWVPGGSSSSPIEEEDRLGWYLQNWSGFAGYRGSELPFSYRVWVFINTKVYGRHTRRKDAKKAGKFLRVLESRYRDYHHSVHLCEMAEMGSDWGLGNLIQILPFPCGKGAG